MNNDSITNRHAKSRMLDKSYELIQQFKAFEGKLAKNGQYGLSEGLYKNIVDQRNKQI